MMRSDMPKQVQVFRNGGGIASLATVPMDGMVGDQPHRLAYINPQEEQILKELGGSGRPGPGGIPMYDIFGYTSIGDMFDGGGKGGSGASFSTKSHSDYVNDNPDDKTAQAHPVSTSDGNNDSSSSSADVGIVNSLLMGLGIVDKTPEYYAATADTIARTQGADAANNYIDRIGGNLNITTGFDSTGNIQSTGVAEALANVNVASAASSFTPSGGGDDGSSYVAPEPEPDPTILTPFQFTNDQLTAQSDFIQRIGDIQAQYTPEQLQSIDIRQQLSSQFAPTKEEFMAITGASEDLTNQLLAAPGQFDLRDWSKIMSSDNPLEAAQAATAAIYLTEGLYGRGQEINPELQLANLDNLIGETDQLFAYAAYPEGSEAAFIDGPPTDVRLGVKTAGGVKLADLGSINSPDFYNVLQGYGYGAEDVAELVPSIEKYYGENVEFGIDQAKYTPVSELDYDYQTFYTPEQVEMYNEYYANADPNNPMPLLGTYQDQQYFLENAPLGRPGDPYNLLGGLQSAAPGTLTKDLGLGQSFLYSSTPGYYGLADPVMLQQATTGISGTDTGRSGIATITDTSPVKAVKQFAADNPIETPYTAPAAPVVYTNPLVPNTGVQTGGIMDIQTQPVTPYQPTVYTPGVYTPAITPLTLPPLG